jgi:hypothetical protein
LIKPPVLLLELLLLLELMREFPSRVTLQLQQQLLALLQLNVP